jgi:hypothetical protein
MIATLMGLGPSDYPFPIYSEVAQLCVLEGIAEKKGTLKAFSRKINPIVFPTDQRPNALRLPYVTFMN